MVFTGVAGASTSSETGADLEPRAALRHARRAERQSPRTSVAAAARRRVAGRALGGRPLTQYDAGDSTLRRPVRDAARGRRRSGVPRRRHVFADPRRAPRSADRWTSRERAQGTRARARPASARRRVRHARRGPRRRRRVAVHAFVRADPDAVESVRNAAAALDPLRRRPGAVERTRTDAQFAQLRRAMLVGASIVIGLIGLSLLLTALEQLRERRRLLAVLVAFGTRRSTLGWSLLWQSAVPVGARARGRGRDRARARRGAAADRRHRRPRRLARRARRWRPSAPRSSCSSPPRACRCCCAPCDPRDCGRNSGPATCNVRPLRQSGGSHEALRPARRSVLSVLAPRLPRGASPGAPGLGDRLFPRSATAATTSSTTTSTCATRRARRHRRLTARSRSLAKATQDLSRFDLDFAGGASARSASTGKAAPFSAQGEDLVITPKPRSCARAAQFVVPSSHFVAAPTVPGRRRRPRPAFFIHPDGLGDRAAAELGAPVPAVQRPPARQGELRHPLRRPGRHDRRRQRRQARAS